MVNQFAGKTTNNNSRNLTKANKKEGVKMYVPKIPAGATGIIITTGLSQVNWLVAMLFVLCCFVAFIGIICGTKIIGAKIRR